MTTNTLKDDGDAFVAAPVVLYLLATVSDARARPVVVFLATGGTIASPIDPSPRMTRHRCRGCEGFSATSTETPPVVVEWGRAHAAFPMTQVRKSSRTASQPSLVLRASFV
jgi:hypothetical protein